MAECRLQIKVVDWHDREFVITLDRVMSEALLSGADVDARPVAEQVQRALRAAGYPRSLVTYRRSAAEVLAGIAHWTVWRDAPVDHAA